MPQNKQGDRNKAMDMLDRCLRVHPGEPKRNSVRELIQRHPIRTHLDDAEWRQLCLDHQQPPADAHKVGDTFHPHHGWIRTA